MYDGRNGVVSCEHMSCLNLILSPADEYLPEPGSRDCPLPYPEPGVRRTLQFANGDYIGVFDDHVKGFGGQEVVSRVRVALFRRDDDVVREVTHIEYPVHESEPVFATEPALAAAGH